VTHVVTWSTDFSDTNATTHTKKSEAYQISNAAQTVTRMKNIDSTGTVSYVEQRVVDSSVVPTDITGGKSIGALLGAVPVVVSLGTNTIRW